MKKRLNWPIWTGFLLVLFGVFSYEPLFIRFPATRDVPWVNLLVFVIAASLLGAGVYRAYAQPDRYRGKISGPILAGLSVLGIGLFCVAIFFAARSLPKADSALRVGQQAPDFTLADTDGKPITLSQLRQNNRAVLLIFYRGHW